MGRKKGFGKLQGDDVRHFRLVARSQYDPSADGEDATPYVLEPFVPKTFQRKKHGGQDEAELLTLPDSLKHLSDVFGVEARGEQPIDPYAEVLELDEKVVQVDEEDLEKDCYFPKDGYNYEKHLKTITRTGRVIQATKNQPTSSSASSSAPVSAPVAVAPGKVLPRTVDAQPAVNSEEAEIVQALENADEFDEADDDFLEELLPGGAVDPDLVLWGPACKENEDLPDLALFHAAMRGELGSDYDLEEIEEDDGSDYGGRGHADIEEADFDQVLQEYADSEIGAIDHLDVEGDETMETCEAAVDEYVKGRENEQAYLKSMANPHKGFFDKQPRMLDKTKAIVEKFYHDEAPEEDDEETASGEDDDEDESRQWDCETVLSTLSNLSNRPGKIGRIKVLKKPAAPQPAIAEEEGGSNSDSEDEGSIIELPDVVTERKRGESTEERKQRKAAVKELKRQCRKMKKESKEIYKTEATKLQKPGTGDIRPKLRATKIP